MCYNSLSLSQDDVTMIHVFDAEYLMNG